MKNSKIFGYMILLTVLFTSSSNAEDWITEEVLKQLSEVRQELKVLQDEIRGLKDQVAQKPAAAPARNAGGGSLDIEGAPFMGDSDAEIAVIEFSDYQCPYCRRHFDQTLPKIESEYIDTGKVKYVMKQFPLGFHAKAKGASVAALCVDKLKPGSYWKAHESMFDGTTSLSNASYLSLAETLGLNQAKFESCLSDQKMANIVDQDMRDGESVGISGTPAFLIGKVVDGKIVNGQLVTGARPFSSFSSVIDKLL